MKGEERAGGRVCDVTFLGPSYGEAGQGATGFFNENASVIGLLEWGLLLSGFHTSPPTFTCEPELASASALLETQKHYLPSLPTD